MYHELGAAFGLLFLLLWLTVLALSILILVLAIVATMRAYEAGREGWWVYLILIFTVPLAGVIIWFFFARHKPITMDGKPFM